MPQETRLYDTDQKLAEVFKVLQDTIQAIDTEDGIINEDEVDMAFSLIQNIAEWVDRMVMVQTDLDERFSEKAPPPYKNKRKRKKV